MLTATRHRVFPLAWVLSLVAGHAVAQPAPRDAPEDHAGAPGAVDDLGAGRAPDGPEVDGSLGEGPAARPWANGVAEADQAAALALYAAGNREFGEARFAQALARYREAIRRWDHPAIRFNMAVCLINLDQPLEAQRDLERSLVFGEAPLGAALYAQGLIYRKLLDAQLAHVEISCRDAGTQITVDGKLLFTAPGRRDEILAPGDHQVVATRVGFLTASRRLQLVAGKRVSYEIAPLESKVAARLVRHWSPWLPWSVLAGGVVVAGAAGLSYQAARRDFTRYDDVIAASCPAGCDAHMLEMLGVQRDHDRARREETAAFALFAVGGAAVIAGVIGLIVNQPRVELDGHAPVVTWTRERATLSMSWGF